MISCEAPATDLNAVDNYWGAADGPSGVGPGTGELINETSTGTVAFSPWLATPHDVWIFILSDGFESGGTDGWSLTSP